MEFEVYNPHNKDVKDLPTIYGFNNGGSEDWWHGQLVSEDGHGLGSHACSNEGFMYGDLGITKGSRPDRHETFMKHYPDGYKMEFISISDVKNHGGLNEAYKLNQQLSMEVNND